MIHCIGDFKVTIKGYSNIPPFLRSWMSIVFMRKSESTAHKPRWCFSYMPYDFRAFTTISCPSFQDLPAQLEQVS